MPVNYCAQPHGSPGQLCLFPRLLTRFGGSGSTKVHPHTAIYVVVGEQVLSNMCNICRLTKYRRRVFLSACTYCENSKELCAKILGALKVCTKLATPTRIVLIVI